MLHSQVTPLLFTTIKHETYTVEFVAHACFSNNGDDIDNAHVYEMTCDLVEAKHLGCYSLPPLEKSRPEIWKAYHLV